MTNRETPFGMVFGEIARDRFPAIARALQAQNRSSADRDAFVLLEPVAHMLGELSPEEIAPEEGEAYLILLHHAFRHWEAGGWVYRVGQETLARAVESDRLSSRAPRPALYIQVPAGRIWRSRHEDEPPEPLDGMFATELEEPGVVSVLGVFGMHRARAGFSAVGIEGRADADDAGAADIEIAARRDDGSPAFAPLLTGGAGSGVYSLANPGELMLLTCRMLPLLPPGNAEARKPDGGARNGSTRERVIDV